EHCTHPRRAGARQSIPRQARHRLGAGGRAAGLRDLPDLNPGSRAVRM
ncbi:hypothetical protein, partial [Arthrobacter sp. DR-2P]